MSRRLIGVVAAVAVIGSLFLVGAAVAQEEPVTFTGCLSDKGDLSSVAVGEAPVSDCKKDETRVSWNSQGPPGIQGVQGVQGEKGDPGVKGDAGEDGLDGAPGQDGSSCTVTDDGYMATLSCDDGTSTSWQVGTTTTTSTTMPPPTTLPPSPVVTCSWFMDLNFGRLFTRVGGVDHDQPLNIWVTMDGEENIPAPVASGWNITNYDLHSVSRSNSVYTFTGIHPEPTPGVYNQDVVAFTRNGNTFYNHVLSVEMGQGVSRTVCN